MNEPLEKPASLDDSYRTVYGPVRSWRVGLSLGIDLLSVNSICSFRCVYCQLGKINVHTTARKVYVSTATVMSDLASSNWQLVDVITLSGSGEPTLATNIGEVIQQAKALTGKPILVLTNSAHLHLPEVRRDILGADKIFCKLDAADEQTLKWMDRPCEGITLHQIVTGIRQLRAEYKGFLAIQTMLTRINRDRLNGLAEILLAIQPDEVQLNLPARPIPPTWEISTRGGTKTREGKLLKPLSYGEVLDFRERLILATGLSVVSAPNNLTQ